MPDPKVPNRNNPFEQFSNSLIGFLKKVETRDKKRDEKLERLVKQMIVYFQLLERAFKNNQVISKGGTQDSTKAGVDKLIRLMSNLDSNVTTTVNKFIKGERLVASEKADIAKLTGDIKDALSESGEKIGIPIKDLLNNFKEILANDELDANFRIDVVRFLKDYSEEDIALSQELKNLLDKISNSNKLIDEDIIKLNIELDKNIQEYTSELEGATFAPFMKINKEINESNILLEDVVDVLTKFQRDREKEKEQDEFKKKIFGHASELSGDLVNGVIRAGALSLYEPVHNFSDFLEDTPIFKDLPKILDKFFEGIPILENIPDSLKGIPNIIRQIPAVLAGISPLLGEITKMWVMSKFIRGDSIFKNASQAGKGLVGGASQAGKNIFQAGKGLVGGASQAGKNIFQAGKGLVGGASQAGKNIFQAGKGLVGGAATGISAAGLASLYATYQLGEGLWKGITTKGTVGEKVKAGTDKTTYGVLTNISQLLGLLSGGKIGGGKVTEESLSNFLMPASEAIGTFIAKSQFSFNEGMNSFSEDFKDFMGNQNKKIFGVNLSLSSLLFNSVVNPLRGAWGGFKNILPEWLGGGTEDKSSNIVEGDSSLPPPPNIDNYTRSDIKSIPIGEDTELPSLIIPNNINNTGTLPSPPKISTAIPQDLSNRKLKSDSDIINILNLNGILK